MNLRPLLPLLVTSVFLLGAFAGCLSGGEAPAPPVKAVPGKVALSTPSVVEGLSRLLSLRQEPLRMEVNVTINVVLVGLDPSLVDTDALRQALPSEYSPSVRFSPVSDGPWRSGLMHHVSYEFHAAPDDFAAGLFAYYPQVSREVDIPKGTQGAPGFLEQYDALYGLGRATSGKMHLVDAEKVEDWIQEHRADAGLSFPEPEHTIFFLDSWSKYDLWEDSYYWYEYANDTRAGSQTRNMRAWGGTYDFFFMDYAAAPNNEANDNSGMTKVDVCCGISQPATAAEGTAYNDPPMWHYDGDAATIGKGPAERTVSLTERIRHAADVAVNLRMLGSYANRPVYKETYYVNVHLWHDGRSVIPKDNLDELLDHDLLFAGLKQQIPWANVTGSIKTYVAPQDDPGMDLALNRAKAEGAGSYVPIQPIYQYIDANREKYAQNDPAVFDVMALLFILEGHYAFFLPVIVGGVAFSGPDGTAWGTISSVNDYRYVNAGMDMGYVANSLIGINAHEIGHFFGLTHAHDGSRRTADGYQGWLDHTWSSTKTVLSYRMRPVSSDAFHVDILARGHTLENLELTLRNAESAYRALDAKALAVVPKAIERDLTTATESYNTARSAFDQGRYVDAVYAAIDARRASERALDTAGVTDKEIVVESWTTEGVSSVGHKQSAAIARPAVTPTGVRFDYRPVAITNDTQRVTVRATWTNGPASWGDFFIGWSSGQPGGLGDIGPVNAGLIPLGSPVSLGGAIHDDADELPTDGAVVRQFSLDLDMFPSFRGRTLWMGAGVQGTAVNGAYGVEILQVFRDHGDGQAPQGLDGSAAGALGPAVVETPAVASMERLLADGHLHMH